MRTKITEEQFERLQAFLNKNFAETIEPTRKGVIAKGLLYKLSPNNTSTPVTILDETIELLETILSHPYQALTREELFEACDAYNYDLVKTVYNCMFLPDLDRLSELNIIAIRNNKVYLNFLALQHAATKSAEKQVASANHKRKRHETDASANSSSAYILMTTPQPAAAAASSPAVCHNAAPVISQASASTSMITDDEEKPLRFTFNQKPLAIYAQRQQLGDIDFDDVITSAYLNFKNFRTQSIGIEKRFFVYPNSAEPQLFCRVLSHRAPNENLRKLQQKLQECGLEAEGEFKMVYVDSLTKKYFVWFERSMNATKTLKEIINIWEKRFCNTPLLSFMHKKPKIPSASAEASPASAPQRNGF